MFGRRLLACRRGSTPARVAVPRRAYATGPKTEFPKGERPAPADASWSRFGKHLGLPVQLLALGATALYINHKTSSAQKRSLSLLPDEQSSRIPDYSPPDIDVSSGYPFQHARPLTPKQVTARLNRTTWAHLAEDPAGDVAYYGAQVGANDPCEDFYVHGGFLRSLSDHDRSKPGGGKWYAWGVFDGHIGAETARALSRSLVPYTAYHLSKATAGSPEAAIKDAFKALDDTFIHTAAAAVRDASLSFAEKMARLVQASNGSCAIFALYDPGARTLRVACTGDSRAVLGVEDGATWTAQPLSEDQGGASLTEQARIAALHPPAESAPGSGLFKNGRVLGLMCSRSFGDLRWKFPADVLAEAKDRYAADRYRAYDSARFATPPYLTAEPEVTTTRLARGRRAFLILASDGLWDEMSSEQAVELVAQWMDWRDGVAGAKGSAAAAEPEGSGKQEGTFDLRGSDGIPLHYNPRNKVFQDTNPAVHLIRNALGGSHHDRVSGVLGLKAPFSRETRDDITVQVVFFE